MRNMPLLGLNFNVKSWENFRPIFQKIEQILTGNNSQNENELKNEPVVIQTHLNLNHN